jgi:uncharacterized membrane protein YeaQ/YmgE (transglycosylase-associated protein family)
MRRRLYFMLPNIPSARSLLDELLLARIEERYIHFYAKEGSLPNDMPEANFLQKTDLLHGLEVGIIIGAFSGLIAGAIFMMFPPDGLQLQILFLFAATVIGALFGSWVSGAAAASIPSSHLVQFEDGIRHGQVLLIIDLPYQRIKEIESMIKTKHPEINYAGEEKHIPVFS